MSIYKAFYAITFSAFLMSCTENADKVTSAVDLNISQYIVGSWKSNQGGYTQILALKTGQKYAMSLDSLDIKGSGHEGDWDLLKDTLSLAAQTAYVKTFGKTVAVENVSSVIGVEKFVVKECTPTKLVILSVRENKTIEFGK